MKIINYLTLVFVFLSTNANSQNLIPNGGFETYSSLPTNMAQCYNVVGWNNVNGVYFSNPFGTPDYFHTLSFMPTIGTVLPIIPNSGLGQIGLVTVIPYALGDYREYISTQLNTTLIIGQDYQLTFYLSNGNNLGASDNFGVHFSVFPLTQTSFEVINVVPQIVVPGIILNNSIWQQYTFTFTANTPAEYITFGNFEDDSSTIMVLPHGYYFIDDIELLAIPTLQIQGSSSICLGDSTTLTAINDTVIGWADSLNPTNILSTDSAFTVSPIVNTTYFVYSATDTASFTVNVVSPPSVNLGNDTTLCQGETVLLDGTTQNASYVWNDNSLNPTFLVTQQGTYWIEVTVNGCSATDSIFINYNTLPTIDLGADIYLCKGENVVLDATTTNATYLWQNNSINPTLSVSQQGLVWVKVTVNNCSASDSIMVNFNVLPILDLGEDAVYCEEDTLFLDATFANATYLWQDNSTNSGIQVTQSGTYWVEVTANNCAATDYITLQFENCNTILEIPNVFSPNGDGVNDFFVPVKSNAISSMKTVIVNRWGNVVFETDNPLINWDGQNFSDGTYFWFVEYTNLVGGSIKINGFVTVTR